MFSGGSLDFSDYVHFICRILTSHMLTWTRFEIRRSEVKINSSVLIAACVWSNNIFVSLKLDVIVVCFLQVSTSGKDFRSWDWGLISSLLQAGSDKRNRNIVFTWFSSNTWRFADVNKGISFFCTQTQYIPLKKLEEANNVV